MPSARSARTRLALTVIAVFAIITVFAFRLVDLQVVRAEELTEAAVKNRSLPLTTYGIRGEILDANGVVLADSVERFDITAAPASVPRDSETSMRVDGEWKKVSVGDALAAISGLTGTSVEQLESALNTNPDALFAYLSKGVTLEVFEQVRALGVPWVYWELRPSRTYPNGAIAGNLIGFIGTDGPQAGVELTSNDCLAQTDGSLTYERGRDGVPIPGSTTTTTEAIDGGNIRLTIDRDVQWFAQEAIAQQAQAIGAEWATAIVMRVSDGHLVAVADYPTVDPNDVSAAGRGALGSVAFSSPYEPGSTFKSLTIASLLDAGVIEPGTQVVAPSRYGVPRTSHYITDAWAHGDLRLTAAGVLMNSSNTGIAVLSERLGAQARHDYLAAFGVGTKTEVGLSGESSASLRAADDWDQITTRTVQFGQGGATATSVQVASIYQTLANGGVRMPVTLVQGCEWPDGTVTKTPVAEGTRVVSEAAAKQTVRILESVVTDGFLSRTLTIPGYRVAAKTGTAEVAEGGRYTTERIVSVAGMAPAENPEYVVVVTYGKPQTQKTSAAAAPTFQKIMAHVLKKYRVVPSTESASPFPLTW